MKKLFKAMSFFALLCTATAVLACSGNPTTWLSPMLAVELQQPTVSVYQDYKLSDINYEGTTPVQLQQLSSVTRADLRLAYGGEGEYKARLGVRVDKIAVEQDGSMGHRVEQYDVKEHVAVLFYAEQTWYDGAYGSNAASGGDTLFDDRYYSEGDEEYSQTRRAILLNRQTAQSLAQLEFYLVGLVDGYYALSK